jgi:hypothetical protein
MPAVDSAISLDLPNSGIAEKEERCRLPFTGEQRPDLLELGPPTNERPRHASRLT